MKLSICSLLALTSLMGCAPVYDHSVDYHAALNRPAAVTAVTIDNRALTQEELAQKQARAEDLAAAIRSRKITKGMTPEQVRLSWGEPRKVSSYSGVSDIETWQYGQCCGGGSISCGMTLVTFTNGQVTSWYQTQC